MSVCRALCSCGQLEAAKDALTELLHLVTPTHTRQQRPPPDSSSATHEQSVDQPFLHDADVNADAESAVSQQRSASQVQLSQQPGVSQQTRPSTVHQLEKTQMSDPHQHALALGQASAVQQSVAQQTSSSHQPVQASSAAPEASAPQPSVDQQTTNSHQPVQNSSVTPEASVLQQSTVQQRPNLFLGIMDRRNSRKGPAGAARPALGSGLLRYLLVACHSVMSLAEKTGRHDMMLPLLHEMQQVMYCCDLLMLQSSAFWTVCQCLMTLAVKTGRHDMMLSLLHEMQQVKFLIE